MRGAAGGAKLHPQDAARGQTQPIVCRLAIDQKLAPVSNRICSPSAVAAPLLADDEKQADARFAVTPQPVGSSDLRGEDPLCVAGTAPVEAIAVDATRKERWNAIEMRRQDDGRPSLTARRVCRRPGDDVETGGVDCLLCDGESETLQVADEPVTCTGFLAGRGIDIDERTRERDDVDGVRGG